MRTFNPGIRCRSFWDGERPSEGGEQIDREGKEAGEERGRGEKGLVTQGYGAW